MVKNLLGGFKLRHPVINEVTGRKNARINSGTAYETERGHHLTGGQRTVWVTGQSVGPGLKTRHSTNRSSYSVSSSTIPEHQVKACAGNRRCRALVLSSWGI